MIHDIEDKTLIYCFVFVSTFLQWGSSLIFLPFHNFLHALNSICFLLDFFYYLFCCRFVFVSYIVFKTITIALHYFYIFQIDFSVFTYIVFVHLLMMISVLYSRYTPFHVQWIIIIEILTRNIYISTYMILSVCSQNFYYSGYIKTI